MKQYLLLLFFYLLSVNWAFAQKDAIEGKSYILCINSYTESSPWSSRLISNVTEFVQKDPGITLYVEHLNMLLVENYKPENEKGFKNFYFRTVTGG